MYALKRALEFLQGKAGTIYTDSKYAYGMVHTFGKIWKERGLITSQGKGLIHGQLITEVLNALELPEEIAVVHISRHQKGPSFEARGNGLADEQTKKAAIEELIRVFALVPTGVKLPEKTPMFTPKEEGEMLRIGGIKTSEGRWILPDGRQMLNKAIKREVLSWLHQESH